MRINRYTSKKNEDIDKLHNKAASYTYICKCSHRIVIYPFEKKERKLCKHCGYYVYTDPEKQKQYDFKKEMTKRLKNGSN